jgi:hypothetical protein
VPVPGRRDEGRDGRAHDEPAVTRGGNRVRTRKLTGPALVLAKKVFSDNLPYNKIRLADDLGVNNRAWTQPFGSGFLVHVGPLAYQDATARAGTLIHELTHVWQGSHGFVLGYVFDSLLSQAMLGDGAYAYALGDPPVTRGRTTTPSSRPTSSRTGAPWG